MPVSKTQIFTESEKKVASLGRALSHPARIRILSLIKQNDYVRNCDLIKILNLTNASVANHIRKLKEADIVQIDYHPNHFQISLKQSCLSEISNFADTY